MSLGKKLAEFWNRNAVMLTGIPLIIGVHWAWLKLQDIPELVKPEEKKELPIVIGAKFLKKIVEDEYHKVVDKGKAEDKK